MTSSAHNAGNGAWLRLMALGLVFETQHTDIEMDVDDTGNATMHLGSKTDRSYSLTVFGEKLKSILIF